VIGQHFTYAPGDWTAVVHWPTGLLVNVSESDARTAELYQIAVAADVESVVDAMLDLLAKGGISHMPAFGLLHVGSDQVRVVLRGGVTAQLAEGAPLAAAGVFSEHSAPRGAAISVQGPEAVHSGLTLPVASAVVRAQAVAWPAAPAADPISTSAPAADPIPAPAPAADPIPAPAPADAGLPAPGLEAAPVPGAVSGQGGGDSFDRTTRLDEARKHGSAAPSPVDAGWPKATPAASVQTHDPHATRTAEPTTTFQAVEAAPPPRPVRTGFIDSFDWRSPGSAAAPEARPPRQAANPPLPPPPSPGVSASPRQATTLPPPPPPPRPPSPPPVVAVPVEPAAAAANFDRTIKRSRNLSAAAAPVSTVTAVRCPQGHLNPPYASACRVCNSDVPAQTPVQVARPPLGVLHLSIGGDIKLTDRGVIFGRNPHLIPGASGPQPHLIRIPDPGKDVSGQHLEVKLDDWFVTVNDLDSTNGTEVVTPGHAPVALRANEPVTIEPGARVVLAGVFDFVFEAV
jgi:hypothetical protein